VTFEHRTHRAPVSNLREYGTAPFAVVVVHGGPGAAGEMAPVARELAINRGILEPLQTANSIEKQIKELKSILEKSADLPVTLIGFSWGAWLACLFAARYAKMVKKLILIGSGGFEEKYAVDLNENRLNRLPEEDRAKVRSPVDIPNDLSAEAKKELFMRYGELFARADAFDPLEDTGTEYIYRLDIFQSVWREAEQLRRSGRLLDVTRRIRCPVVAIHGDYDTHSTAGVHEPLSAILKDFRFILLKKCGHKPWIERQARDEFYRLLKKEL
jgi:pimeloyl-ACP methyl ester carboxylesterase